MRFHLACAALLVVTGCATAPALPDTAGIDVVLVGEQHDAKSHAQVHEHWVRTLAGRGALGAVALEMAERGGSTAGLSRDASEEDVQQALQWSKGSLVRPAGDVLVIAPAYVVEKQHIDQLVNTLADSIRAHA